MGTEFSLWDFAVNQIGVQGIWFALALGMGWLFKNEIDRSREEAKGREDKLYEQLHKSSEQLDKSIEALDKYSENFQTISNKLDKIEIKLGANGGGVM